MYRIPNPFGDDVVLRSVDWLENLPWREENRLISSKDKYEVNVNVKGFAPDEIKVRVSEGFVVVEASHEEKKDQHGYVSRKLMRRFPLPDECLQDRVQSTLSANGLLTVTAPWKVLAKDNTVIPVTVEPGLAVKSKL